MLFIEGFDDFTDGTYIASRWGSGSSFTGSSCSTDGTGAYGYGRALARTWGQIGQATKVFDSSYGTIYLACHLIRDFSSTPDTNRCFYRFIDGSTVQINIRLNVATGLLEVWRGTSTELLATGSTYLIPSYWYWISIKIVFHGSAGSVLIYLNGSEEINISGVNTIASANSSCDRVLLDCHYNSSTPRYCDNLHIYDGTDAAPFNAILSERRIYSQLPTGDGADTGFTASAGSKYACIDENPFNITDYIYSATAGEKYSATLAAFPSGIIPDVVKIIGLILKNDATTRTARLFNKQSGTNYNGDTETLVPNWGYISKQWLTNPAGGAWDKTAVDASEWGIELVA